VVARYFIKKVASGRLSRAKKAISLLRGIDLGWKPTGKLKRKKGKKRK